MSTQQFIKQHNNFLRGLELTRIVEDIIHNQDNTVNDKTKIKLKDDKIVIKSYEATDHLGNEFVSNVSCHGDYNFYGNFKFDSSKKDEDGYDIVSVKVKISKLIEFFTMLGYRMTEQQIIKIGEYFAE